MASRRLVPASVREALLGIPSDIASLERNYLLADDDLDLIGTRRRPENRLGLALHIALLRHPGQGWHDDTESPAPLVVWLLGTHQGAVSEKHLDYYLDEFTFRFNRRRSRARVTLLSGLAKPPRRISRFLMRVCSISGSGTSRP